MARGRKLVKKVVAEKCTLSVAAEEFFIHNQVKHLAPETQKSYISYVNLFKDWYGADKEIDTVDAKVVENYTLYKTKSGIKLVSIVSQLKHLRRFFNFCASRGYMEAIEITIPKVEDELKEPYTDDEMKKLLKKPVTNNWVEYRNWVMVNYFFSTGQRLSTVLNIKVSHLELERAVVKLEHNKDGIKKWMPLSSAMVKILREYIDISQLQDEDYLFPEYEGGKLMVRSAEDAIAKYNRARGVETIGIHRFRHTFAKKYILNGGNPAKLQKLLNHKTIDMTMKYVKLYTMDFADDLDLFNPLDNFKVSSYTQTKRRKIAEI